MEWIILLVVVLFLVGFVQRLPAFKRWRRRSVRPRYTLEGALAGEYDHLPGCVYVMEARGRGEQFLKVGITTEVKTRLRYLNKSPYRFKKLNVYPMANMSEARIIEDQIMHANRRIRYIPQHPFDGFSECFEAMPDLSALESAQTNTQTRLAHFFQRHP